MSPDNCGIEKKRLEIASESRRRRPSPTPFRELRRSVCKSPTSDNSIARFAATRQPAFPIGTELPLDYMLRVMRDTTASATRRDEMARAAAPYLHAKALSDEIDAQRRHALGLLPPPLWGRAGEGGGSIGRSIATLNDPHPQPLPTRGRGVHRTCRSHRLHFIGKR